MELNNSWLLSCILRLIFISYAGITLASFSLLSCVHLGHFGKVLFIDGSIPSHRWSQMVVICVVCCWIVRFQLLFMQHQSYCITTCCQQRRFFYVCFSPYQRYVIGYTLAARIPKRNRSIWRF